MKSEDAGVQEKVPRLHALPPPPRQTPLDEGLQRLQAPRLRRRPQAHVPCLQAQQLASDMFKKMVCGELVNLPIKHGEALDKQWTVPMFMCGNRYMSYQDDKSRLADTSIVLVDVRGPHEWAEGHLLFFTGGYLCTVMLLLTANPYLAVSNIYFR